MESLPKNSTTAISDEELEKMADDGAQEMVDALNSAEETPDIEDPEKLAKE